METKRGGYAHDQEHARTIFRALGILHESQQQRHIQTQGNQHAFEALLFSPRRHDEIGITDGDVAQLILRAVAKTFTPEAAGAHGYLRLQQLITRAFCVFFWMQEGSDSLSLVRLQYMLTHRGIENASNQQSSSQRKNCCVLPLQAPEKSANNQQGHEH